MPLLARAPRILHRGSVMLHISFVVYPGAAPSTESCFWKGFNRKFISLIIPVGLLGLRLRGVGGGGGLQ
jgi:hypothetical protein